MKPNIREYRPSDRSALVRLMEELQDHLVELDSLKLRRRLPAYGDVYATRILKDVDDQEGVVFLAEEQGAIIGCIIGIIQKKSEEESLEWIAHTTGRILELHISDGFRGRGIGKALMEKMEAYFREKECDVSRVEVMSDNRDAYAFYDKQGYRDRYVDRIKKL